MAVGSFGAKDIYRLLDAVPRLIDLPARKMWLDYDDEADVLYIGSRRPQRALDSEMRDDGVIVHRAAGKVVGVTILEASTR